MSSSTSHWSLAQLRRVRTPGWWPWLVGGALVFGAYAWSGQYWLDLVDEGYFLDLASRVYAGQVPYRDFDTYYTPALPYLFAAVFHLFGVSVVPIRLLMACVRAACAMLLVRLTARCAPRPFAVLPFAIVAALDRWPIEPEPHPSWPAITACLVTMEVLARHQIGGQRRWLVLAGAAAAVAFAFKQNVGAFTAVGVAGYIVLRGRAAAGGQLRTLQAGFALALGLVVTVFLWPSLDSSTAFVLWLPLLLTLGLLVYQAWARPWVSSGNVSTGPRAIVYEALLAGVPFALVTSAWLAPLAVALSPGSPPFGLFVGGVNQAGLASPVPQLTSATLHLFLPGLSAWAGLLGLALDARTARHSPVTWYLLFGTLSSLALYPRADTLHLVVASPPILVVGAWALARVYRALTAGRRLMWRSLAWAAVLVIPLAAVEPEAEWRYTTMVAAPRNAPGSYTRLQLDRAPLWLPSHTAEMLGDAVSYIDAGTPPGAPVFVFPAAPLFNFLADRPNPARFDHYFPGGLTDADFREVIASLDAARPRYILWDHGGVINWETDPADRPLSDYIWRCYTLAAAFDFYLVLERQTC